MQTKSDFKLKSKLKLSHRLMIILISGSAFLIMAAILLILNLGKSKKMHAAGITTVISQFDWETGPGIALVGPNAISISSSAVLGPGPTGKGLNPGLPKKDVKMKLPGNIFNVDGIEFSVDYQRDETKAAFIKRGGYLKFEFENGKLKIKYKVIDATGNVITISKNNIYTIPNDNIFRKYMFIYDPGSGIGEVLVDSVVQWMNVGTPGDKLYYAGAGDVTIGDKLNGNGSNNTALDNLLIRSISMGGALPVELITFNAEVLGDKKVKLSWQTASEKNNDYFTLERSVDGIAFEEIATVNGAGNSSSLNDYTYIDEHPLEGISYYRLKQTDLNGAFEYFAPVAVNIEITRQALHISSVGPNPFTTQFKIEYTPAISGIVHITMYDLQGRLIMQTTQQAVPGLNQFAFDDTNDLESGTYILQIEQAHETPVSIKLIKQ